jgi:hypothetical protein
VRHASGKQQKDKQAFVCLHDVVAIERGHRTHAFEQRMHTAKKAKASSKKTKPLPREALCFSVVTPNRTVDLVAGTEEEADMWVMGLASQVDYAKKCAQRLIHQPQV